MKKTRLLLIEENRIFRDSLTAKIRKQQDFEIVDSMGDFADVAVKARELKPDLVLLSMGLGNHKALAVAGQLKRELPHMGLVVMGLGSTQEEVLELVRMGASGFILKDGRFSDLLKTMRSVAQGEKVLPSSLAGALFSQIVDYRVRARTRHLGESARMTEREREVVDLIAKGFRNKEVAERLDVSIYTVKSHVHRIFEKLGLHTRLELATYAYNGLQGLMRRSSGLRRSVSTKQRTLGQRHHVR